LIATDYYGPTDDGQPARIRAYASYNAEALDVDAGGFEQIGNGYFAILIDQGQDMTPYQGITPISGTSLSSCAEAYFAQSEQIPTRFSLAFGYSQEADGNSGWRAGGVMLQHIPSAGVHVTPDEPRGEDGLLSAADLLDGDANENWNRANILLDTVDQLELVGPSIEPTQLLLRLFHDEEPRIFDIQPVIFGCTCSDDRVRQSLSIYSDKDIRHMTTDDNQVTADCQFCGAHYTFDPETLGFEAKTPVENDLAKS
jgi:molecular chaperone Hsp33